MMNRAIRRLAVDRRKAQVRYRFKHMRYSGARTMADDPRIVGKWAAVRTLCSCEMCGNPRHHFGALTVQERRASYTLKEAFFDGTKSGREEIEAPA